MRIRFRRKARCVVDEFVADDPSDIAGVGSLSTPKRASATRRQDFTPPRKALCVHTVSLGVGQYEKDGTVSSFTPQPLLEKSAETYRTESLQSLDSGSTVLLLRKTPSKQTFDTSKTRSASAVPSLKQSMYLRVADLGQLSHDSLHTSSSGHEDPHPHFHYASKNISLDKDSREMYVALDDGLGSHTPIAPHAIEALAQYGLKTAMDESMWKLVKAGRKSEELQSCVWQTEGFLKLDFSCSEVHNEIMVWSGSFQHDLYGHDLPAVRAAGYVNTSPKALCELLIDSSRVKEYNKFSLGREDLLVLQDDLPFPNRAFEKSVTKVVSSKSRPPMLRKVLEFVSILHARELPNGAGYLLVTRAVSQIESLSRRTLLDANIMRSEILMGVNVLRSIEGNTDGCLMINVSHLRSPMVPMMIAKKIGLSAASNFIQDMRACADTAHKPD